MTMTVEEIRNALVVAEVWPRHEFQSDLFERVAKAMGPEYDRIYSSINEKRAVDETVLRRQPIGACASCNYCGFYPAVLDNPEDRREICSDCGIRTDKKLAEILRIEGL